MSSNERKWSLRTFQNGDEYAIFELWKTVYPERQYYPERWLEWWRWMYTDNPCGKGKIWVAEIDGRFVGQYAIAPRMMKVGTATVTSALSLDTMTHPNYRRQGIFEMLAQQVYSEAERDGIQIVYGFPNQFSYPGFIGKLNWFHIDTLRVMLKPLNWVNALRIQIGNRIILKLGSLSGTFLSAVATSGKRAPIVEGLTIVQVSRFDERINSFYEKASHQYKIMLVRNKEYLNWRYVSVPNMDYIIYIAERREEFCGYIVLRCMNMKGARVAIIFDTIAESSDVAQCLIEKSVAYCIQQKIDLIYYASIGGRSLAGAFRRSGFIPAPFVKSLRLCAYSSLPLIQSNFLQVLDNWFVQMGDSDTL